MWDSLRSRFRTVAPRTPEGVRIYAIGDIHGRADLLTQLFASIDKDMASRPNARTVQVMLGDYVDRGAHSKEVLNILINRTQRHHLICLKGNHETYIPDVLRDPAMLEHWKLFGGFETLLSYGVAPSINPDQQERQEIANAFNRALPNEHRRFLAGLRISFESGDYFFAHAGVRPRIPLSQQDEQDLLWIREDFLLHEDYFGKIIVHGHTPVSEPDVRANRINIDTGAYATGLLTCLVLEGESVTFILT